MACHTRAGFGSEARRRRTWWRCLTAGAAVILSAQASVAHADPSMESLSGVPQQVVPLVDELGLGDFTVTTGSVTLLSGSGNGSSSGTSSGGTGVAAGDSDALDTMTSTSWGAQATEYATTLGVDPSAVASTCLIESGCGSNTGSRGDVFQMDQSTYNAVIAKALKADPGLAGTMVLAGLIAFGSTEVDVLHQRQARRSLPC